ncbi:MAG: hypothetical protein WCQ77_04645 [Planctomycetota bacterium]
MRLQNTDAVTWPRIGADRMRYTLLHAQAGGTNGRYQLEVFIG